MNVRALAIDNSMAGHSGQGLPSQLHHWSDLKSAYRFLHNPSFTHARLSCHHWRQTRTAAESCTGPVLFIQDGTALDFTGRDMQNIGRIGNDKGHGLVVHFTIAVVPADSARLLGLAMQNVWTREATPFKATKARMQRMYRGDKESKHWAQSLVEIGAVPQAACWVSVGDRDSDVYRYWQRALQLKWHCLLRARSDRCVLDKDGKPSMLMEQVKRLEPMASQKVDLRSRPGVAARIAHLSLAWAKVSVKPAKNDPRLRTTTPLQMWVIHVWEAHAPDGITPPVLDPVVDIARRVGRAGI